MNENIKIGEINSLKINRITENGFYLCAKDESEVLLPNAYIKQDMQLESILDVFIYTDSEDRLVATTERPYLLKDQFGYLEIVDVAKFGAFVNIGLKKDILVPKNVQKSSFHVGSHKVLKLVIDEKTQRLIATEKFLNELVKNSTNLNKNDEVKIILYSKTPLGFKVIVNDLYEGMIFHSEIFENVKVGDTKKAYIKNIRDDGKLDISLQKIGQKSGDENLDKFLDTLKLNGGKLDFTYKSSPEDIKRVFGLSKKSYKMAITKLLEKKLIILDETSIRISN